MSPTGSPTAGIRRIAVAILLTALAGAAGWWTGTPPAGDAPRAAADRWDLPAAEPPTIQANAKFLNERKPWGRTASPGATAGGTSDGTAAPWRVVGIIDQSGRVFVIGQRETGQAGRSEMKLSRVGELLFDGWIVTEISPTSVVLEREGQEQRIPLFL